MNYILLSILLSLLVIGYIQFKRAKYPKPPKKDVEHSRPDFDKWDDLQPVEPLHRYGLHGQGENRRQLLSKQREQYEKIQGWASKFAGEEIHR
jgi:hypothetical protein